MPVVFVHHEIILSVLVFRKRTIYYGGNKLNSIKVTLIIIISILLAFDKINAEKESRLYVELKQKFREKFTVSEIDNWITISTKKTVRLINNISRSEGVLSEKEIKEEAKIQVYEIKLLYKHKMSLDIYKTLINCQEEYNKKLRLEKPDLFKDKYVVDAKFLIPTYFNEHSSFYIFQSGEENGDEIIDKEVQKNVDEVIEFLNKRLTKYETAIEVKDEKPKQDKADKKAEEK